MFLIFLIFSFVFSPNNSPQQVEPPIIIRKIEIQGNYKTKDFVILRELALKTGDTLNKNDVLTKLESERQKILNLSLFITVGVSLKNESANTADLLIEVKERWYILAFPTFMLADRSFNDWWYNHNHDFSRTIYGIYANHTNLTGRSDKLRFTAETGFISNFSLSYVSPYLDKTLRSKIAIGGNFALNHTLAYKNNHDLLVFIESEKTQRKIWNAFGQINWRDGFYKTHALDLSYNYTKITDTVALANPEYLANGTLLQKYFMVNYTYQYDNRNDRQYALIGNRFMFQATKKGLLANDDVNQWVFLGSATHYFQIKNKFYANFSLRAKLSFPKKQSYLQTIGLGYRADFVRGYELYVIDGHDYALLKTNIKYQLFNKNIDLSKYIKIRQFNTLPLAIYINAFFDVGEARNNFSAQSNSQLGNSLQIGTGIGLDIVTWYNYIGRINYAVNKMGEGRIYFSTLKEF